MSDKTPSRLTWSIKPDASGGYRDIDIQDIRYELQCINMRLNCSETLGISRTLIAIRKNTTKRRRKKK